VSAPGTDAPVADNNGSQPDQQTTPDPWTQTLEGVDEVYRPHVEQAINPLREQFGPRLELADRLEPLSDYADDLLALHQMGDEQGTALQDFLGFAQMASQVDPENPDAPATKQFADWFYDIGEQLGLLDPEDGDDDGGIDGDDDDPDSGGGDVAELRGLVEQLQARLEQAEAAPRIQSEQQRIDKQLATAIEKHHLADDEDTRNMILRLARDYVEKPDMVDLAVNDYLKLTGRAQADLLGGDDEVERVTAGASPGNGVPDTRPDDIVTGDPKESRRRAKAAALSRLGG
jgi:hypothetical protein